MPPSHLKTMRAVSVCRTGHLGGHLEQCDRCGHERPVYNSCRNRHCPKCQAMPKARWLEQRKAELLPVPYFHTVFSVPHELNPLVLCNKEVLFNILFLSVSETLQKFAGTAGGRIGFTSVLHTWDQKLNAHFHLHGLVTAGLLSSDGSRWIPLRKTYLFPVKALSKVYRGKFIFYLKKAHAEGSLVFPPGIAEQGTKEGFASIVRSLWKKEWVVYSKRPFAGPGQVLEYLGRYTHRVAISNNRIINVGNGEVTFDYKDRRDDSKRKSLTLDAHEFIRRFLLHVLPDSFMRIRHFGFMANRSKKENLARCRRLLGVNVASAGPSRPATRDLMLQLTGVDIAQCPCCKAGTMRLAGPVTQAAPEGIDSS